MPFKDNDVFIFKHFVSAELQKVHGCALIKIHPEVLVMFVKFSSLY